MTAGSVVMAVVWLGVVLLLILAASRAVRLLPSLQRAASSSQGDLRLCGSLALDSRRRIHLVDAGGRQALVVTGGAADLMLGLPPASG